jgi:hypothetical protein
MGRSYATFSYPNGPLMEVSLRYALPLAQKNRGRFDGLGARRSNRLLFGGFVVSQPQKANP